MATERKALSKKTRFDVFKRDAFTCQYCWAHPPGVLLHVDHIVAVAEGGSNAQHNLVTACEPCNLGKGARSLGDRKPDLSEQAEAAQEREQQLLGYQKLLKAQRKRVEAEVERVEETFAVFFPGFAFSPRFRVSVRLFIERIGVEEVIDSMERACCKLQRQRDAATKYFCGVCWGKIRDRQN